MDASASEETTVSNFSKLKSKRTSVKASVTRFKNYLEGLDKTKIDQVSLSARLKNFELLLSKYDGLQTEIEILDPDHSYEEERTAFEESFYQALTKAANFLNPPQSDNPTIDNTSNDKQTNSIKLPKIDIPTFSGDYHDWFPFVDIFKTLIDSNKSLSDVQRLQYLKSALKGEALGLLQSVEITAENYSVAWDLLKSRYDNKRLVVQKHIRALINLPQVSKESLVNLRNIVSEVQKHIRALKALKISADTWDDIVIQLTVVKLDPVTVKEWENTLTKDDMPKFTDLVDFLNKKCSTLEMLQKTIDKPHASFSHSNRHVSHVVSEQNRRCIICAGNHPIFQCEEFRKLPVIERIRKIKERRLCLNCFRSSHAAYECFGPKCKRCNKNHNTLLHLSFPNASNNQNASILPVAEAQASQATPTFQPQNFQSLHAIQNKQVLLPTAIVYIFDKDGNRHECRALLDSGSQVNIIKSSIANYLHLNVESTSVEVSGINQTCTSIHSIVNAKIASRYNLCEFNITCYMLDKITTNIPSFPLKNIHVPKSVNLADPNFSSPQEIQLLIGSDLFWKLLCVGQIKTPGQPTYHKTLLGWVAVGPLRQPIQKYNPQCHLVQDSLESIISKFWEIEEINDKLILSKAEQQCEDHFSRTVVRNQLGRFVVQLPFKKDPTCLGSSMQFAERRFRNLEKRLEKDPKLKAEYSNFLDEYLQLGHMKLINNPNNELPHFYMPHHPVIKATSLTTKLRVVFDASAKTSTNISLNDTLMVGPTIQDDLFSILIRFRSHKFVLTGDIEKMYRQILIDPNQTRYQRILWRANPNEPISCFELQTVTYGTASGSYLAIKCLQTLASNHQHQYPQSCNAIIKDFYVDDLLTGASTMEELINMREGIVSILSSAGLSLRKWASNEPKVLIGLESEKASILNLNKNDTLKTLGLHWNSNADFLTFVISKPKIYNMISKRTILSELAQIFDPIGLLTPVTIVAKIIMQEVWQLKTSWDESVTADIHTRWINYRHSLSLLNDLKCPRFCMSVKGGPNSIQLHGFCDASQSAYGACIFIRSSCSDTTNVRLLCSKSRVAPLKAISIPRLELCAALLLSRLVKNVLSSLNVEISQVYMWTDSTIVLQWLRYPSRQLNTFVANRVSEIQVLTHNFQWFHVDTKTNPADLVSRGVDPQDLLNNDLWWSGPLWLKSPNYAWPSQPEFSSTREEIPDLRKQIQSFVIAKPNPSQDWDLFAKYSSFSKLIRITAYCIRFCDNTRTQSKKNLGALKPNELINATNRLVKIIQTSHFADELKALRSNKELPKNNNLLSLNPFICEQGILRIGGRLRNAALDFDIRHPAILPANHPFTLLVINYFHKIFLHAGPAATLAAVRQSFWPLSGRKVVRSVLRKCVTCFRVRPNSSQPIMGNLPKDRVTPNRPFAVCGVDFFGPLQIREGGKRSKKTRKAYAAVFVCFAVKAVHIELVSDLTTDAFIATLKRFIARRGMVSTIYSDNGTNFKGSKRYLNEIWSFVTEFSKDNICNDFPAINWQFIPASSPHFGGLWEAAVKSSKHHLRRVIGNTILNFEEMTTLLCEIESILNSRPLLPVTSDPSDLVLTPGHFLIGEPLKHIPEKNWTTVATNRLSIWEHIQKMRQDFWKRWSSEYLSQLQSRNKWKASKGLPVQIGQLALLKDETVSSMKWKMVRIAELHPGNDGVIRTVTVRTPNNTMRRAVNKLCILPVD